jgi:hypothetical protein
MRNSTGTLLAIIAALLIVIWVKSCKTEVENVKVKIPEIKSDFKPQKPIYLPSKADTVYSVKWKDKKIEVENPLNQELAKKYQLAKDSLERYKMYLFAIQIREFENVFEDENVKLTINGSVQGQLNWIKPKYTIKEKTVEVPISKSQFRVLIGAHTQSSIDLSDFNYGLNLGFQNSSGSIYRVGYSKMQGNDYFLLGYDFTLLKIDR